MKNDDEAKIFEYILILLITAFFSYDFTMAFHELLKWW